MKVIKKITAIMLSIMMVLGMSSVVSAAGSATSGTYGDNNGIITIENAKKDKTYTIYRILKLESFSREENRQEGNYAYTLEDGWDEFLTNSSKYPTGNYLKKDENTGYVTWDSTKNDYAAFAKDALTYAREKSIAPAKSAVTASEDGTVSFSELPLGYYLVDSSAGALCSLDTTDRDVTIQEKNVVPFVKKKVQEDSTNNWRTDNTADIGQTVEFQVTIDAKTGAENYVLHDVMSEGLTFNNNSVKIVKKTGETESNLTKDTEYTLNTTGTESENPKCTFEVVFRQDFCDTLANGDQLIITYSATLNKDAVVAGEGNTNTAKLEYGDKNFTTSIITKTKTYEIPVFKYTKKGADKKALEGAKFTLTRDRETVPIKLVKVAAVAGASDDVYRVAMNSESGETVISDGKVTTPSNGKFTIKGLDAGTYYLTETKQPDGYNKLSAPVKIVIAEDGTITIGESTSTVNQVEVENNTGSLLPSTGGMGTTLFYIFGAILVIGSGVVLITKKRMK